MYTMFRFLIIQFLAVFVKFEVVGQINTIYIPEETGLFEVFDRPSDTNVINIFIVALFFTLTLKLTSNQISGVTIINPQLIPTRPTKVFIQQQAQQQILQQTQTQTPAPAVTTPCIACPTSYLQASNGHCYRGFTERKTAEEARADCEIKNGHLWEPKTLAQVEEVYALVDFGLNENFIFSWVAATEAQYGGSEGDFKYPSGNSLADFAEIDTGGICPNDPNRLECVLLLNTGEDEDEDDDTLLWCLVTCDTDKYAYICENQPQTYP